MYNELVKKRYCYTFQWPDRLGLYTYSSYLLVTNSDFCVYST